MASRKKGGSVGVAVGAGVKVAAGVAVSTGVSVGMKDWTGEQPVTIISVASPIIRSVDILY